MAFGLPPFADETDFDLFGLDLVITF